MSSHLTFHFGSSSSITRQHHNGEWFLVKGRISSQWDSKTLEQWVTGNQGILTETNMKPRAQEGRSCTSVWTGNCPAVSQPYRQLPPLCTGDCWVSQKLSTRLGWPEVQGGMGRRLGIEKEQSKYKILWHMDHLGI